VKAKKLNLPARKLEWTTTKPVSKCGILIYSKINWNKNKLKMQNVYKKVFSI